MSDPGGELTPPGDSPIGRSIRSGVLKGVFWTVGARWILRGLGLISTIVLARLLMPRDFGLIAMATVVIGFLEVLFSQGVDTALIQNVSAVRAHWDTAWTIRVVQGGAMAALLVILAPLASRYYGEPRMTTIMPILALGTLAASVENIGPVAYRKDLQFDRDFQFMVAKKLIQFVVVLCLALVWRDYRALMVGMVFGNVASTGLSYAVHPFRPRWSLAKAPEIWGFSFRLAAINLAGYVNGNAEKLVIGGIAGAEKTGIYFVGDEIAEMPYAELVAPTSRVTVPGFAKIKYDPDRLKSAVLKVWGFVALFSIPASAGLVLVSDNLVTVVLGPRWADAAAVIQLCAVSGGFLALHSIFGNLLMVLGRLNTLACVAYANAILFGTLLFPAVGHYGILGAAGLKGALAAASFAVYGWLASRAIRASLLEMFAVVWRPLASTIPMASACLFVAGVFASPGAALACQIALGAACYSAAICALWLASGSPDGAERDLLEMAWDRARGLWASGGIRLKYQIKKH
jgi:O-antigen/teichoic acid export membrane protein